jgi:tetratricopeptide (TPR) repeat protein
VHFNAKEEASAQLVARYLQIWTPTIHFLLPDGRSAFEHVGYLPPEAFLAALELGLAKAELKRHEYEAAAERFERIRDQRPTSHVADEAAYWAAIARYNASGQKEGLMAGWQKLRKRYPQSIWRWKQSFYE